MTRAEFDQIAREVVEPSLAGIGLRQTSSIRNGRWYCDEYQRPGEPGWSVVVFYELGDWYPDVRAHHSDGRMLDVDQVGEHHVPESKMQLPQTRVVSEDGRALVQRFRGLFCLLVAEYSGSGNE